MTRFVIIEDEPAALRRLKRKVHELRPEWQCVGTADSVLSGKKLLQKNNYELILSDIELSDGDCFEILKDVGSSPVIFITAYDSYAVKAFEFNSIHYLLKPINVQQLNIALEKFESQPGTLQNAQLLSGTSRDRLARTIISRLGSQTSVLNINDIIYIYHQDRLTKAHLRNGKSYVLDQSLDALMDYLPSEDFFRINRQAIVNKHVVETYQRVSSNRLELRTDPQSKDDLIVSKENSRAFKEWL